jgi:hypothetical protein
MKTAPGLTAAALLVLLAAPGAPAGEMKDALNVEVSKPLAYRTHFSLYGYAPQQCLSAGQGGLRFRLPGGVADTAQTGIYSFFALAGDCEVVLTYDLLDIKPPQTGYGSGLGLALDGGEGIGRGSIQRVVRPGGASGWVVQTSPGGPGSAMREEERFVPAKERRGRMGLRREGKELVFLAADGPKAELAEIERLPFTAENIRAVRVYADPGGSPTAVDVQVSEMQARAEQIARGVPRRPESPGWGHWWWVMAGVAGVVGVVLLGRLWRAYRRWWAEDEG